ncbi:HNH endonuclease [Streptomyces sp. NPDC052682]|uniref:HNH endonuclease n=1 Tax=Streptomyces sp. NPDC052682 TaxID=3154954 RepID=UPI0034200F0E
MRSCTQETIKLLFGSASHCAYPDCKHPLVTSDRDQLLVISEIAHIRSGQPGGPRHDPEYPRPKLNTFENLLLLCATHHKLVDRGDYSVAELLIWKGAQVAQPGRTLAEQDLDEINARLHLQHRADRRALYEEIVRTFFAALKLSIEAWQIPADDDQQNALHAEQVATRLEINDLRLRIGVLGPDWIAGAMGAPMLALTLAHKYGGTEDFRLVGQAIHWFSRLASLALEDPDRVPDMSDFPVKITARTPLGGWGTRFQIEGSNRKGQDPAAY